jgi:hypothetical protein
MLGTGKIMAGDAGSAKAAVAVLAADPTKKHFIDALAQGDDPNGVSYVKVCGPQYGCGARLAKAPPTKASAPLWILSAAAASVLLRRRRPRAAK